MASEGESKLLRNENGFNGGSKGGFRIFFRGQNYRLILESNRNRTGDFMERMKIQNGEVKKIKVPGEFQFKGCKSFLGCLDKLFTRNQKPPVSNQIRPDYTKRSEWKIQSKRAATQGQRDSEIMKIRPNFATRVEKSWKRAVVIFRQSSKSSWESIRKSLEGMLGRKTEVVRIAADRVVPRGRSEKV